MFALPANLPLVFAHSFGRLTLTTAFRPSRTTDLMTSPQEQPTSQRHSLAAAQLLTVLDGEDSEYRRGNTGDAPRRVARRTEYNFRVAFNPRGSESGEYEFDNRDRAACSSGEQGLTNALAVFGCLTVQR
jgi:hypothetical protein